MRALIGLWSGLFLLGLLYLYITSGALPARVPFGLALTELPERWVGRASLVLGMLAVLLASNAACAGLAVALRRGRRGLPAATPWRRYWAATEARTSEARQRLAEVAAILGITVNAAWLVLYHLLMQVAGSSLMLELPPAFGLYLIAAGVAVVGYGSYAYFKPPA